MRVDLKIGNQSYPATSKNLGVGGLFVATDREFRVGDQVIAELSLPGHVRPIAVGAEVRWIQVEDNRPNGLGLRFLRPSLGLTVAIHGLLQTMIGSR
jgi:type IV pilus assembly protein PilZ